MGHGEFEDEVRKKIEVLGSLAQRGLRKHAFPAYLLDIMEEDAKDLLELIRAYRRHGGVNGQR